jgi:hypothetical protein
MANLVFQIQFLFLFYSGSAPTVKNKQEENKAELLNSLSSTSSRDKNIEGTLFKMNFLRLQPASNR